MKKSNLLLLASLMALTAGAANAQTAAPAATPAAPPPPTFGAAIPGQCVLDGETAIRTSKMGVAAIGRLGQLGGVVQSELQMQNQAIEAEAQSLAAKEKTATATAAGKTAFQASVNAWRQKQQALQVKAQQRQQEMQYTQQEVMAAIFSKMIPNINAVVSAKGCSTVIAASSLLQINNGNDQTPVTFTYVNPAMDITAAVVQKMDSTGELLPAFERVNLDQQQQAPAPKAAPAAKPAAAAGAAPKK